MDTTGTPSISPFLFCADVARSLEFLERAFGLTRAMEHKQDDGTLRVASATLGGSTVYLSTAHPGQLQPASTLPANHSLVMVYTDDVDSLFNRAREAGAVVEYEPQDMPYGQRECGLRDLDGNLWSVATVLPG